MNTHETRRRTLSTLDEDTNVSVEATAQQAMGDQDIKVRIGAHGPFDVPDITLTLAETELLIPLLEAQLEWATDQFRVEVNPPEETSP